MSTGSAVWHSFDLTLNRWINCNCTAFICNSPCIRGKQISAARRVCAAIWPLSASHAVFSWSQLAEKLKWKNVHVCCESEEDSLSSETPPSGFCCGFFFRYVMRGFNGFWCVSGWFLWFDVFIGRFQLHMKPGIPNPVFTRKIRSWDYRVKKFMLTTQKLEICSNSIFG